ncbi:Gmad2 immunoglobulin-like domain-containing protein [Tumebacillus permanentifrigoris]|uniref:Immunoglobulin-like protein involved in spore germination n=1 Tax=Tumebacillus permanentifrigoris TaxID=378543 RepID=A0A316DTI9_9BACL|nr:Gmad2 immunoglobulin-like domain-containing protein [Tumebacillus permanentifrigoris]PWK10329.1 immunoglobulin-like protein involved in spore germination [Tumebacillus permanentifrigoris]
MSFKRWATASAIVVVLAGGGFVAYQMLDENKSVTAPVDPQPSKPAQPDADTQPQPAPKPADNSTTPNNTQDPKPNPNEPSTPAASDVITLSAYTGSGSYPLKSKAYTNNSFQLERVDWSESSKTLSFVGKMRAFEAVGYFRVRDQNKVVIESESVLRASAGAPEWGNIKADLSLVPEYKGQTLTVDFYTKSAKDGSRTDMLSLKIKLQ